MKRTYWVVEGLTGTMLMTPDGRSMGAESSGRIYSRHRTEAAAHAAHRRMLERDYYNTNCRVVRKQVDLG